MRLYSLSNVDRLTIDPILRWYTPSHYFSMRQAIVVELRRLMRPVAWSGVSPHTHAIERQHKAHGIHPTDFRSAY